MKTQSRQTIKIANWFGGRVYQHHRKMGTAGSNQLHARLHHIKKDCFLGGYPVWHVARATFHLGKRPYVSGGLAIVSGYRIRDGSF